MKGKKHGRGQKGTPKTVTLKGSKQLMSKRRQAETPLVSRSAEESKEARHADLATAADTTAAVVATAFSKLVFGDVSLKGMVGVPEAKVERCSATTCGTLRRYRSL